MSTTDGMEMTLRDLRHNRDCIRLFVYGTLKRGYWNHEAYCSEAAAVFPARTWGRLYQWALGIPYMELPDECVLSHGTAEAWTDTDTQNTFAEPVCVRPEGDWELIEGDLIVLPNPEANLPPIDGLEGFRPEEDYACYERVLVPVQTCGLVISAWMYRMREGSEGERLSTRWEPED